MIVAFLDHVARDAQALYILGDLFDYWFEYGTVVPKGYVRLLGKLAQLSDAGISISYLTGNHDFWLKSYFTNELNIEVMREPVERLIGGRRFYLHHGDGLLRRDVGYRMLKRVLRNPVNMFLFSLLPPDAATAIARWSSRTSRAHTSARTYESDDMTRFARQKIEEGFDFVVMGHNHAPLIRNIAGGIYVNLGDWIEACTYAVFDGASLQLKAWHREGSPG
jgi:UDP-2,3-diacylglucosamine hydrolase